MNTGSLKSSTHASCEARFKYMYCDILKESCSIQAVGWRHTAPAEEIYYVMLYGDRYSCKVELARRVLAQGKEG